MWTPALGMAGQTSSEFAVIRSVDASGIVLAVHSDIRHAPPITRQGRVSRCGRQGDRGEQGEERDDAQANGLGRIHGSVPLGRVRVRPGSSREARTPRRSIARVIRITTTVKASATTIKADGRLLSGDAEELMRVWEGCSGPVVIDLSDLSFADAEGATVLKELRARGATLVSTRPYVAMLLEEERSE